MNCQTVSPELLGLFGLAWNEKVADFMAKMLKGTSSEKLMSRFLYSNTTLVDNLQREYASQISYGRQPVNFVVPPGTDGRGGQFSDDTIMLGGLISSTTHVDAAVVLEFLRALWVLARDGKIPFAKLDPKGVMSATAAQKSFSTEKTALDVMGNSLKTLLIIAGLGVGAYALAQVSPFIPKPKRKG